MHTFLNYLSQYRPKSDLLHLLSEEVHSTGQTNDRDIMDVAIIKQMILGSITKKTKLHSLNFNKHKQK